MTAAEISVRVLSVVLLLLVAGCGGGADEEAPPVADAGGTEAADPWVPVSETAGAPVTEFADAEAVTLPQGHFRVRWPANCVDVRTNLRRNETDPERYDVVSATGLVDGDSGCGFTVWAWLNEPDGAASTPELVMSRVSALIEERRLTIVNQSPVRRLGMEGVVAYCRQEDQGLVFWIEAYLSRGRTLLVAAWERGDYMFEDPEILRFFRSVEFID